jgi:hypothetical protein
VGRGFVGTLLTDRDQIARDKFRGDHLDPFAIAVRHDVVRRDAHRAELGEGANALCCVRQHGAQTDRPEFVVSGRLLTWKTTVHSNTTSMKAVKSE